ncbi:AraC family transcriptional regulator [Bailinhaonella thermotolerans]|uniref:AraC family transcriptional regulator n=1 Tax=Bailinhaonella thermotolerans TaxID=1070861 RepID=A0A3A4BIJ4_9ACTN|nr:AraC family transcriptional regulator [Bailinhaonella thermotolerans]
MSIMIPEEDPVQVAWAGRSGPAGRMRAVVAGLHLGAAELRQEGPARGVWVRLTPLGARALLGVPASEPAGRAAELADVVPELADLPERLAARPHGARREVLEDALLAGLARHGERAARSPVGAALAALRRAGRVEEAARLLGCSRRHLGAVVRSELGVTPKEYQRLVRFEAARGRLVAAARAGEAGLAAVAAASGFADQAHLSREWRAMAGCTPTEWLRAEGPAVLGGRPAVLGRRPAVLGR